jgi:4-carboxymuconolactone decarboxylase
MTVAFDSERYRTGLDVLEAIGSGAAGIHRWQAVDPVVGPQLDRMLGEFCFGDVWAGDGLDHRTRRTITLTTIAVLGRPTLLEGHIRGALAQGFSRRDVLEIFVHVIAYAGFPVGLSAVEVAARVFEEIDGEAARPSPVSEAAGADDGTGGAP